VGSKGDEAMILSVVTAAQKKNPSVEAFVLTATDHASEAASKLGLRPVQAWGGRWSLRAVTDSLRQLNIDSVYAIGGDVMDGYYGAVTPAKMLLIARELRQLGAYAAATGFSFNRNPHPAMQDVFNAVDGFVQVNLRDRESLARFQDFATCRSKLVADVAFLLDPSPSPNRLSSRIDWVSRRKAAGDLVLGVNVHPMLVKSISEGANLVNSLSDVLKELLNQRSISLMLLSHDYRSDVGDDVLLRGLYERLGEGGDRIFYPPEALTASELKHVASHLDGLFTGRMHLAIAALGSGVPVAALTYQDKFVGLFGHFEIDSDFLISPAEASDQTNLRPFMKNFLSQIPQLAKKVQENLPKVTELAELNLYDSE